MNTLDRPVGPASSKSRFVATNTTRSRYEQANTAKRVLPPPSPAPASPANPPFKKPRVGESPMQGRSKSDAILLDDSQELEDSVMDDIQYTPEPESGTTTNGLEPHTQPARRAGRTGTTDSSRQPMQDTTVMSRLDSDEHSMLPTGPRRNRDPPPRSTHPWTSIKMPQIVRKSRKL